MKKKGGIPAKYLTLPIVLVLLSLHAVIIALILQVSASTARLSATMDTANKYTAEATELIAGASLLSETSINFVLRPDDNVGSLMAHANELSTHPERRSANMLEKFDGYDIPETAKAAFKGAVGYVDFMMGVQLHAIALIRVSHPVPDLEPLKAIPAYELTQEELDMSAEERDERARNLVIGSAYAEARRDANQEVADCNRIIREEADRKAEEIRRRVGSLRTATWLCSIAAIAILLGSVISIQFTIFHPLIGMANSIPKGEDLNEEAGLKEVRTLAVAYNEVNKRRSELEAILRSAAETDALTGIYNRYCYDRDLLELEGCECPVSLFLFDINYLKETNDTKGHLAGDELIRTCAECISSCFGDLCYRLGGDEFAAIIKDHTRESVQAMVDAFENTVREKNVSISFGGAYTENAKGYDVKLLVSEADKRMYERKKKIHRR